MAKGLQVGDAVTLKEKYRALEQFMAGRPDFIGKVTHVDERFWVDWSNGDVSWYTPDCLRRIRPSRRELTEQLAQRVADLDISIRNVLRRQTETEKVQPCPQCAGEAARTAPEGGGK
jgi:predicted nucleic acid-binding Zn ribbon protein